jgi:tRNA dimethylallyltransferase
VQKLTRALEIRMLTGGALPRLESGRGLTGYSVVKIGLDPDRAELFKRLDARVVAMFSAGLVEEVAGLIAGGASGDEKPFESLGYRQTVQFLRGEITRERAVESTQTETRQYAKRQWTWFRRDQDVKWLAGFGEEREVVERAKEVVGPAF